LVALYAVELVTALEHAVELVHEKGDRLVALVGLDGGIHIGALDLDVALCLELDAGRRGAIAFQLHAEAHDAFLVSEQSLGLLAHERLERRGELEVDARYDYFVVILAVHVSAFCCG